MGKRRYAALAALYAVSEHSLAGWENAAAKQLTKAKYDDLKGAVAKELVEGEEAPDVEEVGNDVLAFDPISGRYFTIKSLEEFRSIVISLNEDLYADMFVSINDLYFHLGLPRVRFGDDIGWSVEYGAIKPRFTSTLTKDERPAVVIDYESGPEHIYNKIH